MTVSGGPKIHQPGLNLIFAAMGRIIAIDYGSKRVGLAVTDPGRIIATGLTTVHSSEIIKFLQDYCQKETVDIFVVGEARKMDNTPSDSSRFIEPFVKNLTRKFPNVKVDRMDERFTSKIAFQSMIDSGLKKKDRQNKSTIDEVSAVILLQDYLQKIKGY